MFYRTSELHNYKLGALDGEIGKVKDDYFDDRYWTTRYLVADTGHWLSSRKVLISPLALIDIDPGQQTINTELTKKQIEDSPSIDADMPVSRQHEEAYYGYYGWTGYWYGGYAWGDYYYLPSKSERKFLARARGWDADLRSSREVRGYHISARDGEIGHIDDFIIEDLTWAIRYIVVDTRNWWPGKKVMISSDWIENVSWYEHEVYVNLNREDIKTAPEYTDDMVITRDYEMDLYRHYNLEGYWVKTTKAKLKM